MFQKILLACDGSSHALRSAEKAIEIARTQNEAVIYLVYVVNSETSKSDVLAYGDGAEAAHHRKLIPVEEKLKEAEVSFVPKILKGEPGPEIVKEANANEYDLVVVGSRGLNTLQEMVLGSVSHKVAKRVNCPVLIVK